MMKFSKKQSIHGKEEAFFRGPATPGTSGGRPRAPPEILKTPTTPNESAGEARVLTIAKKAGLILLVCVFATGGALIGSYLGSVWDKAGGRRAQHRSPPPLPPPQKQPDFSSSGPATTSRTTPEEAQEGFSSGLTSSLDSFPAATAEEEGLTDHLEKDDSVEKEGLGLATDLLEKEAFQEEGLPDYDAPEAEVLEDGSREEETLANDDAPEAEDLEKNDSVEEKGLATELLEKEALEGEGLPDYDAPETQVREDDSREEGTLADDDAPEAEDLEKDDSVEEKGLATELLEKEALEGEGLPDYDTPQAEFLEDDSREEGTLADDDAPTVEDLEGEAPVEETATPEQEALANHLEHPSLWEEETWARLEYQENSRRFSRARAALKQHRFEEAHELLVGMAGLDVGREIHHWAPAGNFHSSEFHADLGVTLVNADRFHDAIPLLAKGLRGAAGSPKAFCLNALGVAYRNLGDPQSALQAFRTAVQLAPNNPKAWTNFGVLAMELGDLQQADDAFYYAAEALGPKAGEDEFLVRNVQALQNRARGLPGGEPGALELWYENDEPEA